MLIPWRSNYYDTVTKFEMFNNQIINNQRRLIGAECCRHKNRSNSHHRSLSRVYVLTNSRIECLYCKLMRNQMVFNLQLGTDYHLLTLHNHY